MHKACFVLFTQKRGHFIFVLIFQWEEMGWRREKEKINASLFFGIFFFLLILLLFFVCLLFLFTITNKHNMCEVVLATNIAKSVFWGGVDFQRREWERGGCGRLLGRRKDEGMG